MTDFALHGADYTWKNALLWGNFVGHCKEVAKGTLGKRIVHVLIAALEFLPIVGQIASIFEKIIVGNNGHASSSSRLSDRKITEISYETQETSEEIDHDDPKVPLSCGGKHDQLVKLRSVLEGPSECIPAFFGFTNDQIHSLFSEETRELWNKIKRNDELGLTSIEESPWVLLDTLQERVEKDILSSTLPLTPEQTEALESLQGKTLIVRSSSNEDGMAVNAGGNESIGGVEANEDDLKTALAKVVGSYFSEQSFLNRSAFENPFTELPLCSVLVMEQIIEDKSDPTPIVSGVMMTSKTAWSAPDEEGITHISASWGFGSGTSNKTICDEWALTDSRSYPAIRCKLSRLVPTSLGETIKEPNGPILKEIPCLSDGQLKQLRNVAKKLESYFKQPMDVEFVIKNGLLYIVQVRPIQTPNISEANYLDPESIPEFSNKFEGKTIVGGSNQVISLKHEEVVFEKDLDEAEKKYTPERHTAVVVYTDEKSSNTHPAVNFSSQRPPVPCLVMPYEKWLEAKKMSLLSPLQLCPQTGMLVETRLKLPVREGLFLHPARLPISITEGNPMQGESRHPSVLELKQLLKAVPEVLEMRLDDIQENLSQLFSELSERTVISGNFAEISEKLRKASFDEVEEMRAAANSKQMTRLAFHAGMLRQLLGQSGKQIIGAHSISGLEAYTYLPDYIDTFIQRHENSELLCQLAHLGLNGFDEPIQRKWLDFLEKNSSEPQLKKLLEDLQKLETLEMATHWFSTHFSDSSEPQIDELLIKTELAMKSHSAFYEFGLEFENLLESLEMVDSIKDLEDIWQTLQEKSDAFLNFCKENQLKHPLTQKLIDLWDLSTKAVRTSHLFTEEEEADLFKARVKAFKRFGYQASESVVLNYSISDLLNITSMTGGRGDCSFSVQHWLIPTTAYRLPAIRTNDQKLTVIHQNLLQAASYGKPEHLPSALAEAYNIFNENCRTRAKRFSDNTGTYISIDKNRASVRINIPLNLHSTVVTLSQKKGDDEIEVTNYIRHSDNGRGRHLNFFKVFSKLAGIPLKDSQVIDGDLKVVCTINTKDQANLLSQAIDAVNYMSLCMENDIEALVDLFDPEDEEAFKKEIIKCAWEELKQSGMCPHINGLSVRSIWKYLEEEGHLSELTRRVIEEWKGNQAESDFSRKFTAIMLKSFSIEKSREIVWRDLIGKQNIKTYYIPKKFRTELLTDLFYKVPAKAKELCKRGTPKIFVELMSTTLGTDGLQSKDEADLLCVMAIKCEREIPEQWISALKAWNPEEIQSFIRENQKNLFYSYEAITLIALLFPNMEMEKHSSGH